MPRRAILRAGSLGGLGVSLADLLGAEAARGEASIAGGAAGRRDLPQHIKSVIQINLPGGFPQHESFDPKPEAPVTARKTKAASDNRKRQRAAKRQEKYNEDSDEPNDVLRCQKVSEATQATYRKIAEKLFHEEKLKATP